MYTTVDLNSYAINLGKLGANSKLLTQRSQES